MNLPLRLLYSDYGARCFQNTQTAAVSDCMQLLLAEHFIMGAFKYVNCILPNGAKPAGQYTKRITSSLLEEA